MDETGAARLLCGDCQYAWVAIRQPSEKTNDQIAAAVEVHSCCPSCNSKKVLYHPINEPITSVDDQWVPTRGLAAHEKQQAQLLAAARKTKSDGHAPQIIKD